MSLLIDNRQGLSSAYPTHLLRCHQYIGDVWLCLSQRWWNCLGRRCTRPPCPFVVGKRSTENACRHFRLLEKTLYGEINQKVYKAWFNPEPILNQFPSCDIPLFFPSAAFSITNNSCRIPCRNRDWTFHVLLFRTFHCRGAFLARCLTRKFMLETVKCRCAVEGMSWPRWNDENREYKITTELPVHKPLSTCQNRNERYQYFCNVPERSSGIFWRLAEIFLQFLSIWDLWKK